MQVEYDPETSILIIGTDWSVRRNDFLTIRQYRVRLIPNNWGGRAFQLDRHRSDILRDKAQHMVCHYSAFVSANGEPTRCDCRGMTSREYCRHTDALKFLIESEVI